MVWAGTGAAGRVGRVRAARVGRRRPEANRTARTDGGPTSHPDAPAVSIDGVGMQAAPIRKPVDCYLKMNRLLLHDVRFGGCRRSHIDRCQGYRQATNHQNHLFQIGGIACSVHSSLPRHSC